MTTSLLVNSVDKLTEFSALKARKWERQVKDMMDVAGQKDKKMAAAVRLTLGDELRELVATMKDVDADDPDTIVTFVLARCTGSAAREKQAILQQILCFKQGQDNLVDYAAFAEKLMARAKSFQIDLPPELWSLLWINGMSNSAQADLILETTTLADCEDTRQRISTLARPKDATTKAPEVPHTMFFTRKDPRGPCTQCGKPGHTKRRCPEVTCYKCNKKGHIAPDCSSKAAVHWMDSAPAQAMVGFTTNQQDSFDW